jgi:D-galactose 1-dehydrogenase
MSSIAIGIVGFGKIARDQHLPAITATERMHLAAIADPVSSLGGVPSYLDFGAMLGAHREIATV